MTRFLLAAGVAALAISAPASSAPGGGKGEQRKAQAAQQQRGGGGGGRAAQARSGGRGGRAAEFRGGGQMRMQAAARPNGGGARFQARQQAQVRAQPQRQTAMQRRAQVEQRAAVQQRRGQAQRQAAVERRATQQRQAQVTRRANQQRMAQRQAQTQQRVQRQAQVQQRAQAQRQAQVQQRAQARNQQALARAEAQRFGRNNNPVVAGRARNLAPVAAVGAGAVVATQFAQNGKGYGVGGCPPGLSNKGCMPPGQAQKLLGQPVNVLRSQVALDPLPVRLQSFYPETPNYYYQYGGGYVYQVNRSDNLISALLPLFGLGYGIGQPFPYGYPNYYMPAAYQPFFPQTPYYDYRYADCYTYEVDPFTGMIVDTIPTFAYGCGFGQVFPASYSAYNVPYPYRSLYYDTGDYNYRYAPGAIYQVDPTTSLVTAVAALLTGGFTVGQPLPVGYSAYNIPYDYRATYYDTPTVNYRYSDGYIYSVDPVTGLVTNRVVTVV